MKHFKNFLVYRVEPWVARTVSYDYYGKKGEYEQSYLRLVLVNGITKISFNIADVAHVEGRVVENKSFAEISKLKVFSCIDLKVGETIKVDSVAITTVEDFVFKTAH